MHEQLNFKSFILTSSDKSSAKAKASDVTYLYKGITQREYRLASRFAKYIEVQQAAYEDSLLKIDLQRFIAEEKLSRKFAIIGTILGQKTLRYASTVHKA